MEWQNFCDTLIKGNYMKSRIIAELLDLLNVTTIEKTDSNLKKIQDLDVLFKTDRAFHTKISVFTEKLKELSKTDAKSVKEVSK